MKTTRVTTSNEDADQYDTDEDSDLHTSVQAAHYAAEESEDDEDDED